ncbi:MAG: NAD-dependent epimerase/dehydratase family protein [Sphingobium sp.]|nr:NAD-dependent epimerase/dehydratase family protein [Sphingobium sp.]
MLTVITGAAGFVGQAVVAEMLAVHHPGRIRLVDRVLAPMPAPQFASVVCDVSDKAALRHALADATHVIHLSALPGGASEANPVASRRINVDATLDLIAALSGTSARLVYASSIAVLGSGLNGLIDDETVPRPGMTYGAHKLMCEIAIEDAVRRGDLSALALRLPGIVARPRSADGFGSAFLSDLFWAIRAGDEITVPVSSEATTWLISARQCARNLLLALQLDDRPAVATMPALRVQLTELVAEISQYCGTAPKVQFKADPRTETLFGAFPALVTAAADGMGLKHDGDLPALVRAVFEGETAK